MRRLLALARPEKKILTVATVALLSRARCRSLSAGRPLDGRRGHGARETRDLDRAALGSSGSSCSRRLRDGPRVALHGRRRARRRAAPHRSLRASRPPGHRLLRRGADRRAHEPPRLRHDGAAEHGHRERLDGAPLRLGSIGGIALLFYTSPKLTARAAGGAPRRDRRGVVRRRVPKAHAGRAGRARPLERGRRRSASAIRTVRSFAASAPRATATTAPSTARSSSPPSVRSSTARSWAVHGGRYAAIALVVWYGGRLVPTAR